MADIADDTIFISRAGADSAVAIRIAKILRTAGYETILQDEDFRHTSFMAKMQDALTSGARVIGLLSNDYLESEHCSAEWGAALAPDPQNRKQRVIFFRVRECAPAGLLGPIRWTDLSGILDDPVALADKVRNAVGIRAGTGAAKAARTLIDNDAIWDVPSFTGREEALTTLRKVLFKDGQAAVTQPAAVHGMGGVGKSALAKEYAKRNRSDYAIQWWFNAEKEDGIVDGLIRLGTHFLPDIDKEQDRTKAAKTVLGHIFVTLGRPALLVFDNIEQPALIAKWKPHDNAHVLVTSRLHGWGGSVTPIEIEEWPADEARDYLLKESGRTDITPADAAKIAATLGYLPLALAHAAAFLRDNRAVSVARYIARTDELMDQVPDGADYPKAVYATFQQALASAEKKGPGAAAILCLCAFYAPDDIPLELLEQEPKTYPSDLAPVFDDGPDALALRATIGSESVREGALSALAAVSLIDLKPETRTFSIHRLVQAACRDLMSPPRHEWSAAATSAANSAFPDVEFSGWPLCARLMPHAELLSSHVGEHKDVALVRLLNQAALYLTNRAEFARAEPLHRRALAVAEKVYGPDHPDVAIDLNNLAMLLSDTNRSAEAEPLYRRALAINEEVCGPDHPAVSGILNNLALLLRETSRFVEAESLYRRALTIDEKTYGPDHPTLAIRLINLGGLLRATDRVAEAEPYVRRALAIAEKSHGPRHPTVATALNNLGVLMRDTNRPGDAEALQSRALAIDEDAYGPDHPAVARSLNNLALLWSDTNRLEEAVPMAERAAAIFRMSLGEEHPHSKAAAETARDLRARLEQK